jgi:hypothetical protein
MTLMALIYQQNVKYVREKRLIRCILGGGGRPHPWGGLMLPAPPHLVARMVRSGDRGAHHKGAGVPPSL